MGEAGQGCAWGTYAGYREAIERSVDPALFVRVVREFAGAGLTPATVPGCAGAVSDGVARDTAFVRGMKATARLLTGLGHSEEDRLAVLHRLLSAREILEHPELATHIEAGHGVSTVLLAAMATAPCRLDEERPGFELDELLRQVEHLARELRAA